MRVAVVSDIHGNRQALEAVLDDVEAAGADELWCLGDLVGYGADPDACVALIRRYATVSLAGNHDLAVARRHPARRVLPGAALAARWTQEALDPDALAWLRTLQPQTLEEAVDLYHASPRDPVWEYVLSTLQAELCLDLLPPPDRVHRPLPHRARLHPRRRHCRRPARSAAAGRCSTSPPASGC